MFVWPKSTVHTHVHMLLGQISRKERETYVCVFYDKYHTDLPSDSPDMYSAVLWLYADINHN